MVFGLRLLTLSIAIGLAAGSAWAGEIPEDPPSEFTATEEVEQPEFKAVEYTAQGLDIRSRDGNFLAHINWRPK